MKHWSYKYISMDFSKMNCAQFVEYVLQDHFKIYFRLPQTRNTISENKELLKETMFKFVYPEITDNPKDGDGVLMRGIRMSCHIGLYVNIKNVDYVLHTEKKFGTSCLHKFSDLTNYGFKVEGVYKWLM